MKRFENVDRAVCREMEKLDRKYGEDNTELTIQDLQTIRLLYSSMVKSQTYYAMQEESDWDEDEMEEPARRTSYGKSSRGGRDWKQNYRRY